MHAAKRLAYFSCSCSWIMNNEVSQVKSSQVFLPPFHCIDCCFVLSQYNIQHTVPYNMSCQSLVRIQCNVIQTLCLCVCLCFVFGCVCCMTEESHRWRQQSTTYLSSMSRKFLKFWKSNSSVRGKAMEYITQQEE